VESHDNNKNMSNARTWVLTVNNLLRKIMFDHVNSYQ
jgi:hypothetical protein